MTFAEILSEILRLSFAERQEWMRNAIAVDDAELTAEENALLDCAHGRLPPPARRGHSARGAAWSLNSICRFEMQEAMKAVLGFLNSCFILSP